MMDASREITPMDIVVRLSLVMSACPCHRPVIGSQIMGGCERCDIEAQAWDEIAQLRRLLADLLNDCDNWGCSPSDRYAEALRGVQ